MKGNIPKEPIKYTSMLWQAKTYIELEEYEKAEDILKKLIEGEEELTQLLEEQKEKEKKAKRGNQNLALSLKRRADLLKMIKPLLPFRKILIEKLLRIYADLFLRQKKYPKAVEKLEKAIELEKKTTI